MGAFSLWHYITVIAVSVGFVVFVKYAFTKSVRNLNAGNGDGPRPSQEELHQELKATLKRLNNSLGFAEGTGPTSIMLDGVPHLVSVGHTEWMRDPKNAVPRRLAYILSEVTDLESALNEAIVGGDLELARKIRTELDLRILEADVLAAQLNKQYSSDARSS